MSRNWFEIGREYTGQRHRRQQIRDAVRAATSAELMRALPRTYRNVEGEPGGAINIGIAGDSGRKLRAGDDGTKWILFKGSRPFTNQFDRKEAPRRMEIDGRRDLSE